MMTNIGSALEELVAAVIESNWPQEEDEYRDWAIGLGLPDVGEPVVFPHDDAQIRRFQSLWKNEVNIGWSFYQGKFVGLSIIAMIDLEDIDLGQDAAEYLRRTWQQRYGLGQALDDPIRGFTELWEFGELRLDYYWHTPRWVEEFSAPISGGIQIEIDRAILADLVAAMTANA